MSDDWSREEVEATVADYFLMWSRELTGHPVNKREHNRALRKLLRNRSSGAVEFKHQNISAVLIDLGYPYIEGYKPRSNYQTLLAAVVTDQLAEDRELERTAAGAVASPIAQPLRSVRWDSVIVPPPSRRSHAKGIYERRGRVHVRPFGVNYLEREARNAALGLAGERFILDLEHERLRRANARALADRIEHVSHTRGNGLGYDVLSFEEDGRERLVEVKTTRFGEMTPFFASRNEVEVSRETAERYHLYRLYSFGTHPKLFVLSGSLSTSVLLDPMSYRASIR